MIDKKVIWISILVILGILLIIAFLYTKRTYGGGKEYRRPRGVPIEAIFIGGVDGGNWISCKSVDGNLNKYDCSIYSDSEGILICKGSFLIGKIDRRPEKTKEFSVKFDVEIPSKFKFKGFDGVNIYLQNELILVPDGWIYYPFNNESGKKQEFNKGIAVSKEIEY